MDPRLQRRVQRYGWDKAAACYQRYWAAQLAPGQQQLLEFAALQPGECVLDVACGTGLVTLVAAEAVGSAGHIVATDLSESMVAHVAAEAEWRRLMHVSTERMDAESLRFDNRSFDAVLCAFGLMYVPDAAAALKEMVRVLRPGGRAAIAVWGARHSCGWADIFPIVERRVSSEVCPLFFQLGTGDRLRMTMETAGFTDISIIRMSTTLSYASDDDACGAAFAGGPVALAYSRFDAAVRDDAHVEYLRSIESWRIGRGFAVPGEFVVARGLVGNDG